ncbi:hypothetical protein HYH02_000576 [Chlamydomonas schloesseri]|uniref:Pyruvate kinase n=1 Tax=Chlamydomonas schloesseri TaxID=2026947 RepID=A0A835WYQ5_9CHLO|nr:hypothetical protein HYH02_000576 [Chlamydomonas schloesseri]|eukprot:KAG2454740.1 hypothetical protein HYH02_000576 [Chlamydomonas schloesseri]
MGGRGSKKTEEEGSDAQLAEQSKQQEQTHGATKTERAETASTVAGLEGSASVLEPLPVLHDTSGESSKASLKHNDSHGSHLHMGMKISSTVSFGQLTEEVSKPLSKARSALKSVHSRMDLIQEYHLREVAAAALKREKAMDWLPEYRPISVVPPSRGRLTHLERTTRVSQAAILNDVPVGRKTKIVCTLGPSCWSEEGLAGLLDAGMDVARFNFSHGTHQAHQEVLDRLRKVVESKKRHTAFLLDTKGPEVRTAMLKDGKDIELVAGQEVIVVGVGDEYTTWEGYKDKKTGETKIGISYAKLCSSIKVGGVILIADGAISIEVVKILNDRELLGRVVNSHKLGQRKNCNLPGVHVDLPVLSPKDIDDVQNFAVKNQMDFIAASFVQCADDVKMIRRVLDEAGGYHIKIICKIENEAGLRNIDSILEITDGIMVARGDLAMEVPAEKIALAQKMIIAKCNVLGKTVITATQMLESMTGAPLPTRAEMTDVANAVYDGTDAVMLSGETANGAYPHAAVRTMAHIVEYAELGVDYAFHHDWVKRHNAGLAPVSPLEATLAGVAKSAITFSMDANGDGVLDASEGCVAIVFTRSGLASQVIAKYRPPCPVIVLSDHDWVLRQSSLTYGLYPLRVEVTGMEDRRKAVEQAIEYGRQRKLVYDGKNILVVSGSGEPFADTVAEIYVDQIGSEGGASWVRRAVSCKRSLSVSQPTHIEYKSPFAGNSVVCVQSLRITPELIIERQFNHRSTKIFASLGPASYDEKKIEAMLDNGVSVFRIFLHEAPTEFYQKLVDRLREHFESRREKCSYTTMPGLMATIKGPEVRTTLLKNHTPLKLAVGETVVLVPTMDPLFEGFTGADGAHIVGVNFPNLTSKLRAGDVLVLAEGTISLTVKEVVPRLAAAAPGGGMDGSVAYMHGKVMTKVTIAAKLGEDRAMDLAAGSLMQDNFLGDRDREAVLFCAKNMIDFVSIPNVRSRADVMAVRELLDSNGGARCKIIAHVSTAQAIANYDEILDATDAVLISRAYMGMRIPAAKVSLAQKWMTAKANLKGKPCIVSAQIMYSMVDSPRPTRAEMTDVANALYDGADALMLREETAVGSFVERVVSITADILRDAEVGVDIYAQLNVLRNFTPKPMPTLECLCSSAVKAAVDMRAALIAVITDTSAPVRALAKYRPGQAIVVVTTRMHVARQCNINYGCVPMLLRSKDRDAPLDKLVNKIVDFARTQKLAAFQAGDDQGDQLIILQGPSNRTFATEEDLAEMQFVTRIIGEEAAEVCAKFGYSGADTIAYRSTKVGLDLICGPTDTRTRKTKVVCTLGPKCWTKEGLEMLVDTGLNVARFNFSHGSHADHQQVLHRLRGVLEERGAAHRVALLLDTKGPEVRTAMLKDGKDINLEAGQELTVVAVGEKYTTWEGYKDEETGETKIGLSYQHLCRDVKVGGMIKIGDGLITLEVLDILSPTELRARALNSKALGQRKNVNLPGVHVDMPVLGPNDINDVQNFAAKNKMDFVAASFVQSADDVRFIRKVLDEAGGQNVRIISKIESTAGLVNYDAILAESDGIMVARGDLAMEIPSEKVALAQKMMITKANIAGKFIITATQMLESMIKAPLPTRAEMTDVANAVFDGTDAVMLSGETANGDFPQLALATMCAIAANAEVGTNYPQVYDFIRDFSARPMSTAEAVLGCAAKNVLDVDAALILVISSTGASARLVAKYRPRVPVLLITDSMAAARAVAPLFGVYVSIVDELPRSRFDVEFEVLLEEATLFAMEAGLCPPGKEVVVVHGCNKADAEDGLPMVEIQVAAGGVPSRQASEATSGNENITPKPSMQPPKPKRTTGLSPFAPAVPPSPAAVAFHNVFNTGGAGIHHVTSGMSPFGSLAALAPGNDAAEGPKPQQPAQAANKLISDVVEESAFSGAAAVAATALAPRRSLSPRRSLRDNIPAIPSAAKSSSSAASHTPSPAPTAPPKVLTAAMMAAKTLSLRTTAISLVDILDHSLPAGRKTKIVCTLGPSCWTEEGLNGIINAGMDVARFNFSHGTHQAHQEVLDRLRKVEKAGTKRIAYLLDTKGPEVRTAMLKDGKDIKLEADQEITVVAVGDDYDKWEGYKDEKTGETKIGISYAKLCQSVRVGSRILVADGSLTIEVLEILSATELRGRCLNTKVLGQRKNVNLPGVHVDIPVLTPKDIEDLQKFCVGNSMDFVAASFVQSADDVRLIRRVLDDAGGVNVQIISKIENEAGLKHFDAILAESDGIMVARGDLAMEIPSEKVALAQKMMITKCNIAGKFVITATQMLESMTGAPLPTRAEMTDVANAVFDGTDAVMLSGETANGKFPRQAVETMAAIVANAENGTAYVSTQWFIRDHTPKPFGITEATGVSCVAASVDCNAQLIITLTSGGYTSRFVSKYRPAVPQIVVTDSVHVANQACVHFGQYALLVDVDFSVWPAERSLTAQVDELVAQAALFAQDKGLWAGQGTAILLHGRDDLSADSQPVLRAVDLADIVGGAPAELIAAASSSKLSAGTARAGSREAPLGRTSTAGLARTSVTGGRAFSLVV